LAVGFIDTAFESADLLVLSSIEAGLFALFNNAVVQVDSGGESASDGGDKCSDDEALLLDILC